MATTEIDALRFSIFDCMSGKPSIGNQQSNIVNHQSTFVNRQSAIPLVSCRINQAAEARIGNQSLEVFVAARVDAVFGAQGESRFEVSEGHVHVPAKGVRHGQGIADVILIGFQLIGLAQVFERLHKVAGIQTGNPQRIILVGRFGSRGSSSRPLPAKAQMHLGPLGHVAGVAIYKLFKYLRSFVVILFLKSPHPRCEVADGSLVSHVDVRPFRNREPCAIMSRTGPGVGGGSPGLTVA
jgi:hypothetical protein